MRSLGGLAGHSVAHHGIILYHDTVEVRSSSLLVPTIPRRNHPGGKHAPWALNLQTDTSRAQLRSVRIRDRALRVVEPAVDHTHRSNPNHSAQMFSFSPG